MLNTVMLCVVGPCCSTHLIVAFHKTTFELLANIIKIGRLIYRVMQSFLVHHLYIRHRCIEKHHREIILRGFENSTPGACTIKLITAVID